MSDFMNSFERKRKKNAATIFCDILLDIIIIVLLGVVIARMAFTPVIVDGESMNDTLYDGEYVLISDWDRNFDVGDIVVIKKDDYNIIKRIVAVSGDKIAFLRNSDGTVDLYRNDFTIPVKETFLKERMINALKFYSVPIADNVEELMSDEYSITVGEGQVFVMGDNRNNSDDSRKNGCMEVSAIKGKMVSVISGNDFLSTVFGIGK